MFADYERSVADPGGALDADTVRVYISRVRQYLAWLAAALAEHAVEGDPLTDSDARDRTARDYRTHLQTTAKRKPATINAHLTAVDDFYRRRGLGPAAAERADLPPSTPRALDERDQLRLLREADRAPLRDKAIAYTAFYAGTRISETTNLNTDDIQPSTNNAHLIVRYGKNGRHRQIPLHPRLRVVLEEWLRQRADWKGADTNPALFLNRRGGRLSARSAYTVLRTIAAAANLPLGHNGLFTPRVLRHTAGTTMTAEAPTPSSSPNSSATPSKPPAATACPPTKTDRKPSNDSPPTNDPITPTVKEKVTDPTSTKRTAMPNNTPDNSELIIRFHPVGGDDVTIATTDFNEPARALEAIGRALDEHRSLTLTKARYNRETDTNAVVINLANVVSVRVSSKDSAATGQYL